MLLLMETWSAACCWFSDCTNCSIVRPDSDSRCSIQVSGNARAGPCPCRRRANSATNELTIGGFDRAMSAITRIRLFGSFAAISVIWSAQWSARLRSILSAAIRARNAAEILDQRQAQHDGNGPQFAQLQGGDGLVGGDEAAENFRIHPPIAVRDRLQRDVIDARQTGRWAVHQARQFPAVPFGKCRLAVRICSSIR